MVDLSDPMRVFVTIVDLGGFTAAANRLELTPSGVSRIVARLEDRLGVRLLHRTTRRIGLTPEGDAYYSGARQILAEIDEMEASVGQSSMRPRGLLRVNTGTAFAIHQLMPKLPEFLDRYPEIDVAVEVTDRVVDLTSEGTDVAIRTGPIVDGSLVVRRIADFERVICAAPAYLEKHGVPQSMEDLAHHNCLLISGHPSLAHWPFRGAGGPSVVQVRGRATVASADAVTRLAVAGAGIARLGDILVAEAIRAGTLVRLLEDVHVAEPIPLAAVYPSGRYRSPKVRVFIEFLVEQFRHAPWRIGRTAETA